MDNSKVISMIIVVILLATVFMFSSSSDTDAEFGSDNVADDNVHVIGIDIDRNDIENNWSKIYDINSMYDDAGKHKPFFDNDYGDVSFINMLIDFMGRNSMSSTTEADLVEHMNSMIVDDVLEIKGINIYLPGCRVEKANVNYEFSESIQHIIHDQTRSENYGRKDSQIVEVSQSVTVYSSFSLNISGKCSYDENNVSHTDNFVFNYEVKNHHTNSLDGRVIGNNVYKYNCTKVDIVDVDVDWHIPSLVIDEGTNVDFDKDFKIINMYKGELYEPASVDDAKIIETMVSNTGDALVELMKDVDDTVIPEYMPGYASRVVKLDITDYKKVLNYVKDIDGVSRDAILSYFVNNMVLDLGHKLSSSDYKPVYNAFMSIVPYDISISDGTDKELMVEQLWDLATVYVDKSVHRVDILIPQASGMFKNVLSVFVPHGESIDFNEYENDLKMLKNFNGKFIGWYPFVYEKQSDGLYEGYIERSVPISTARVMCPMSISPLYADDIDDFDEISKTGGTYFIKTCPEIIDCDDLKGAHCIMGVRHTQSFDRDDLIDEIYWNINGSAFFTDPIDSDINVSEVPDVIKNKNQKIDFNGSMMLEFEHTGSLPDSTVISIDVGERYKAGTSFTLWQINEDHKIEPVFDSLSVDAEGTIDIPMEHCSSYILTQGSNADDIFPDDEKKDTMYVYALLGLGVIVLLLMIRKLF